MNIIEVNVAAGRTIPDPKEKYRMHRTDVTIKATLADGEDVDTATVRLLNMVEERLDYHEEALTGQRPAPRKPTPEPTTDGPW